MIPVEASVKGLQSLIRTLELINELKKEDETFGGRVLGVVPFRELLQSADRFLSQVR
jgi:chromosome partitioning protein